MEPASMPHAVMLSPHDPAVVLYALRDRSYRAAFHILEAPVLLADPRVWTSILLGPNRHLGHGIDFPQMLADGTWSHGERLLIEAGASVFNPRYEVSLYALQGLDDENKRRVLEAIAIRLGLRA